MIDNQCVKYMYYPAYIHKQYNGRKIFRPYTYAHRCTPYCRGEKFFARVSLMQNRDNKKTLQKIYIPIFCKMQKIICNN